MDRFWIEKAIEYISEHNAFDDVTEVDLKDSQGEVSVVSTVSVGLPSKYIKEGVTNIGVKDKEDVTFVFDEKFPLVAPVLKLRKDFPRCFPHINPSSTDVCPCVFEGNLSELLLQSEWMNGILNQVVDWLEKAASNELLDYAQGWEPMRNDHCAGYMLYDPEMILEKHSDESISYFCQKINYEEKGPIIVTGALCFKNKLLAQVIYINCRNVIGQYLPNEITTLEDLYTYLSFIGSENVKGIVEAADSSSKNDDKIFLVLSVRRPAKVIGSNSSFEFLNFLIHKVKKRKSKKRVLPECKVEMLAHIVDKSPKLMRHLSGTKTRLSEEKNITLIGCGSLGSKLGMHLARNGNGPFLCVDNDIFLPHNNARHALTMTFTHNKAFLLAHSISGTCNVSAEPFDNSAFDVDYNNTRLIIDTSASLAVRAFLMGHPDLPPVISGGLYGRGSFGVLFTEGKTKNSKLPDLWAHLYLLSLTDKFLQSNLYSSTVDNVRIGQSCSSQTMIVDDSRISQMASTMSLKIQKTLESGLVDAGEILIIKSNDDYSLETQLLSVPRVFLISSARNCDWKIYLSEAVKRKMELCMEGKAPNETGGVLLGTVFLYSKTIVITSLIDAPVDSVERRNLFVLGTDGLEREIKSTEKKTNGKVTYLGTWHSHPHGGSESQTDRDTYRKLLFVRNHEPTICLIVSRDGIVAL